MNILVKEHSQVGAKQIWFEGTQLHITLTDERVVILPIERITWLRWLANATPEERADWSIEPSGYAVYWEALDDGFEIAHALSLEPVL